MYGEVFFFYIENYQRQMLNYLHIVLKAKVFHSSVIKCISDRGKKFVAENYFKNNSK